jgi:hypothetical protein
MAPKAYRTDAELIRLGFEAHEALALDGSGWPIPRNGAERDFSA